MAPAMPSSSARPTATANRPSGKQNQSWNAPPTFSAWAVQPATSQPSNNGAMAGSSLRCSRSAAASCFCSLAASTPARMSISRSRSDASRPAMTSRMFVSRSLKPRFSFEKTQSVPRSMVGVEMGTQTAAGKSSGTFHVGMTLSSSSTTAWPKSASRSATAPCSGLAGAARRSAGKPYEQRSFNSVVASSRR